jgi:uncharacterized protein YcbX
VISVTKLSMTPVKGTRLHRVDSVQLSRTGAAGDRRFFVIDDRDRMINSKNLGALHTVVSDCRDGRLALRFPDGRLIESEIALGEPVTTRFYSEPLEARTLEGPWAEALSEHVGRRVRLVEPEFGAVDRGAEGAVSLISRASLDRLAAEAGQETLDSRRFRMLIEVDGVPAHAEDGWVGEAARVGQALVRFKGHVGRCLITSRDPESGEVTLPTLDILGRYRGNVPTTEPLPLGVYGEVLEAGTVRVGDAVERLR